jgi:hypothetical protein
MFPTITSNNFIKKKEFPCQNISLQQIVNILTTKVNSKTNKKIPGDNNTGVDSAPYPGGQDDVVAA